MREIDATVLSRLSTSAQEAREHAYAPYSHFRVGAALLTSTGEIFTGANVENASYSMTLCAERIAIGHAVSEGHRDFAALVIVGDAPTVPPCGACRQVLSEFGHEDLHVAFPLDGELTAMRLGELLPISFHGAVFDSGQVVAWPG